MDRVAVPDGSIAYEHRGAGSPVLLVMGFGGRGLGWRPLVERLPDHHCAWFDHRGTGASSPLRRPTSMAHLAEDALAVADALGWSTFHVVGVSMGGMVAQHLAIAALPRLRSLTLLVTTAHGRAALRPQPANVPLLVRTVLGSDDARADALVELLVHPDTIADRGKGELAKDLKESFTGTPLRTLLYQRAAIAAHDTRGQLHALRGLPTLLVGARHDRLVPPRETERLHVELPHAQLAWFEAGHRVHADAADPVAERIRRHLEGAERLP